MYIGLTSSNQKSLAVDNNAVVSICEEAMHWLLRIGDRQ